MLTVPAFSTWRETFFSPNNLNPWVSFLWEVFSTQCMGTNALTLLTFVIAPKKGVGRLQIIWNWVTSPHLLLNPKVGPTYTAALAAGWHRICLLLGPWHSGSCCGFKGEAGFGEPVKYLLISFLHLVFQLKLRFLKYLAVVLVWTL